MKVTLESFDSGWSAITVEMTPRDIDLLIERLQALRGKQIGHFHWRRDDFSRDQGVADVEFSMDPEAPDDMTVE